MKITHIPFSDRLFGAHAQSVHDLGLALAAGSVIFDGTYNAFAKGLTAFLSPITLLLLSEGLTALFVILTVGLMPIIRILFSTKGKEIFSAMLVGVCSSGIAPLLWFKGLSHTTAINASLLHGLIVVFTLLFGYLFLNEKINRTQTIGMLIVLFGTVIIALGYESGFSLNPGDGYIVLSVAVFALGTILFKKYVTSLYPEIALLIRSFSGIIFALIVAGFFRHPFMHEIRHFPPEYILTLIAFAFFSRFLAITLFYSALTRIKATSVALINQLSPLVGMFFAVLILHERMYAFHVLGVVLIIFGLVVEQLSRETISRVTSRILRFRSHGQYKP